MQFAHRLSKSFVVAAIFALAACSRASSTAAPSAAPASASPARSGAGSPVGARKLPDGVTPAMISEGDSLFNTRSCVRCHGEKGAGGANGPAFANKTKWHHGSGTYDDIVKTIIGGVPKEQVKDPSRQFAMRARGGMQPLLDDGQVARIAAYVWSLSNPAR